jgi:hypothetical protein
MTKPIKELAKGVPGKNKKHLLSQLSKFKVIFRALQPFFIRKTKRDVANVLIMY